MPRWDLARLTSGANVYFDSGNAPDSVPFVREDVQGGVTTVAVKGDVHTLYTNGKFQGNDGWEMQAQRSFAHYPSLFVKSYERALVIGLGTATTLGTFSAYPWKRIDVVEISPAIIEAADRYFNKQNRNSLHDPRVRVHVADGRNHLLVQQDKFDLISMELSSIWFAGAASLYSRDFYKLVDSRLKPDAVFQQWVQLHHVTIRDFATIVHTLREVFPHVALFYGGGQGILVASRAPLRVSRQLVDKAFASPEVASLLPKGKGPYDLLDEVLVEGPDLDRFLAHVATAAGIPEKELVSTDDNIYLEFATPRGNVLPWSSRERLVAELRGFSGAAARNTLVEP
jgi:spermidine synthase